MASTPTTPAPEAETYLPDGPLPAKPARPLNPAGNLAAKASDVTLKPGEVLYIKNATTSPPSDLCPDGALTYEYWVPRDRNAPWLLKRTATGDVKGGRDEQRVNGGKFEGNTYEVPDDSAWSPSPNNVAALSRDPAVLYEKLRAEVNATPPAGAPKRPDLTPAARAADIVFTLLADPSTTVPADLRAAVLRTLGLLPGITVRFADGRPAVIVSWQLRGGQSRTELVPDPATARPIMYQDVATAPVHGVPPGQAIWSSVSNHAVVHALGQRP
ncbi:MAG TPA: hypothetical protein VGR06_06620 [Actinophytocola sp.]|uniref:hypothetical protein n=1 Tax=Actinophytocola sp. TaxID=1872138 RepID=UPI002DFDDE77|nr:hypothetical protein [Actinophytocola sp.]